MFSARLRLVEDGYDRIKILVILYRNDEHHICFVFFFNFEKASQIEYVTSSRYVELNQKLNQIKFCKTKKIELKLEKKLFLCTLTEMKQQSKMSISTTLNAKLTSVTIEQHYQNSETRQYSIQYRGKSYLSILFHSFLTMNNHQVVATSILNLKEQKKGSYKKQI